jgi:hypothetical protein
VSSAASIAILFKGPTFLGMDSLGWVFFIFTLLLFGIPYTRFFLRRRNIASWPIMSARVSKVEIFDGVPQEYVPRMAIRPGMPVTIPYHCRAQYAYLVDGTLYPGWFALLAKSLTEAQGLAKGLQNLTIKVKYDPRKPADSALEEPRILDKKVVQSGTNPLNPTVW